MTQIDVQSEPFKVYNVKSGLLVTAVERFDQAVVEARRLRAATSEHHGVCHVADCGTTETWSEEV
jgi:hypothetical protein